MCCCAGNAVYKIANDGQLANYILHHDNLSTAARLLLPEQRE